MILFTILAIIALLLIVFTVIVTSVFGAVGIVIFADVIVCVAILIFIIRKIANRKN